MWEEWASKTTDTKQKKKKGCKKTNKIFVWVRHSRIIGGKKKKILNLCKPWKYMGRGGGGGGGGDVSSTHF
jgi:hypothetical protein